MQSGVQALERGSLVDRKGALRGVNLTIDKGEFTVLAGPSGSGKTTLLNIIGALDAPTTGAVRVDDRDLSSLSSKELSQLRRDKIGFVFQAPYLIPFLDATDNVALLPMLAGVENSVARATALDMLTALDVQHRAHARVPELSGGEQQRVAIARALANKPPIILADEPTAPLDSERALAVVKILNRLAQEFQTAIIVVTHDEKIIPTFKRIYHIRDGKTYEELGEGRPV